MPALTPLNVPFGRMSTVGKNTRALVNVISGTDAPVPSLDGAFELSGGHYQQKDQEQRRDDGCINLRSVHWRLRRRLNYQ